jgi:hypothetical protein
MDCLFLCQARVQAGFSTRKGFLQSSRMHIIALDAPSFTTAFATAWMMLIGLKLVME